MFDLFARKRKEEEAPAGMGWKRRDGTRPPVKDSVLELRPRMARMLSIVEITSGGGLPVLTRVHFLVVAGDVSR